MSKIEIFDGGVKITDDEYTQYIISMDFGLYFLEQSTEMGPIWDKNEVELEYEKQKGV